MFGSQKGPFRLCYILLACFFERMRLRAELGVEVRVIPHEVCNPCEEGYNNFFSWCCFQVE